MKILTKVCYKMSEVLCYCSGVAILVLMIVASVDVFMRSLFNSPMVGSYEISQYFLCIAIYGGFAFCQCRNGHIHVTMFLYKMPRIPCFIIWSLMSLASAAMGIVLTVACWQQSIDVKAQGMQSILLGIPQFPFQFFAGVCMLVFAFALLLDGIRAVMGIFNKEYADEIRSTWVG